MRDPEPKPLEDALVKNAAATLAGVMPSNLFTIPGRFLAGDPSEDGVVARRRAALDKALTTCDQELSRAGVRLKLLVWRGCGALVFVYRPALLRHHLMNPACALPLLAQGYPLWNLDRCLDRLATRIAAKGKMAVVAGPKAPLHKACRAQTPCKACATPPRFPHEVGYLLGYPPADVNAFIRHDGQGYALLGPWKAYRDVEGARRTFERIHSCAETCMYRYLHGARLAELALVYA